MYKDELSVFIPNSFLSESKDLKIRTYKVGILGRALAVYRVNNVVIYNDAQLKDDEGQEDGEFIAEILRYMNTPQYLRKRAFPIRPELKHVGILPPLRTPHHPVDKNPQVGDYRQGFTVKRNNKGTFVDIGMDKLAFCKEQLSVKKIFSFKITKIAKKEVIVTPDEPDDVYWGYNVMSSNKSLKNSLKLISPDLVVETTRYGDSINSIFNELKFKVEECKNIAILFGGPYSSIQEDVSSGNWDLFKVNTIPEQGTETVRSEEAVIATLSLINFMRF
ncbi:MAG: putative RNA uridine N3 methyltransferase [Methanobrevibacter sp.]|uniref:putative RNA uridine N3 methyltransferase n=1 Tax=Methanobrevibacter sp. TaxID=66852 RepID=UPI0026E054F7|nr:putative RNA uridine N3 methyltransferase [Methanobrevibacter sp.]MDO5848792.1 putative RNA uridine N3 methyltransferase [Methanobrevibacter sp.]